MKYFTILLIFIFLSIGSSNAQENRCEKWDVIDIPFNSGQKVGNPFNVKFGAVFVHPSGKKIDIPGFYDGNNTWIIRFSPAITGKWEYETYSTMKPLAGKKGSIDAATCSKPGRHGAVLVDQQNLQRFRYEDGTVFFPMAFEIDWLFALDAGNKNDIPKTAQIVKHIADHNFNKVIMNVFAYDAAWGEREKVSAENYFAEPGIFPFGGTNEKPDHSELNVDFFRHFDRVMRHLHEKEIVSHLMVYVWNKSVSWAKPGTEEDNMYFEYVVKRYQAFPNLIWDISKEALAYGMDNMEYIIDRIERLKKTDGHQRLITVHDYTFCNAHPDLVDFISVQEWRPNLYDEMLGVAKKHTGKPVFNVEHGGYEQTMHSIFSGAYTDPETVLERSYQCLFAGTYTTYYWQNSSWYEVVYEPFLLPSEMQPHFNYYKILTEFFRKYDYNKLHPEQYFFSPYCLTDDNHFYLYLLPQGTYALQGMSPEKMKGKTVSVQWFNPLNGSYSAKEESKIEGWTSFVKPAHLQDSFAIAIFEIK